MENYNEILKAIQEAKGGYWMPISAICVCFSVIISLLLYIWNQTNKNNEKRHSNTEKVLDKLTENTDKLTEVVTRLEVKHEMHEKILFKKS